MAYFDRRLDIPLAWSFWRFGWPIGVLQIGWQFGSLALYAILGRLPDQPVAATAALTNGLRIEAILYLPAFALNMVTAVLVARALGGGDSNLPRAPAGDRGHCRQLAHHHGPARLLLFPGTCRPAVTGRRRAAPDPSLSSF